MGSATITRHVYASIVCIWAHHLPNALVCPSIQCGKWDSPPNREELLKPLSLAGRLISSTVSKQTWWKEVFKITSCVRPAVGTSVVAEPSK